MKTVKRMGVDFPRRSCLDLCTPAEKSIYNAIQEVEKAGADATLTEAINLLDKARNLVADYVEATQELSEKFNIEAKPSQQEGEKKTAEEIHLRKIQLIESLGHVIAGQRGISIDKLNKVVQLFDDFIIEYANQFRPTDSKEAVCECGKNIDNNDREHGMCHKCKKDISK